MAEQLLTRDHFREQVFARDGRQCVFCEQPAIDVHHILERRLWPDGGYYLANGASVCERHHIDCEKTIISCDEVRARCGITKVILPPHLYEEYTYDKWGNIILSGNRRAKGELFFDESVQKVLKEGGVLDQFVDHIKYPRTMHLPWSESVGDDDRVLSTVDHFVGKEVVVSAKMDGENSSLYHDYFHARSLDGNSHPSQNWVKNFWNSFRHDIPKGWRLCGENLYAQHSLRYEELDSYFLLFSVWNDCNLCLSWEDTVEWADLLNLKLVPVLYRGDFDENIIKALFNESKRQTMEGYVVRLAGEFPYSAFPLSVAKFVRKGHVQTTKHNWRTQAVIPNKMKAI
jgi:hypothetical protein